MCDCDYICRACMKDRKCEPGKYIYIYMYILHTAVFHQFDSD